MENQTDKAKLVRYLRIFLLPTLVLKAAILYFGLNYSSYPGEGYGTGLAISIGLAAVNFGVFLWKSWDDYEEES